MFGSIAVIGPTERIKATGVDKIGRTVRSVAMKLSMALGHGNILDDIGLLRRVK